MTMSRNTRNWDKIFDSEPRVPKSAKTSKQKDRFFASNKYRTWFDKQEKANKEVLASSQKLYDHLRKSGLKIDRGEYYGLLAQALHGRGSKTDQLKAKAKLNLILTAVGRNEPKTKSKYKLPSQSQISRFFRF